VTGLLLQRYHPHLPGQRPFQCLNRRAVMNIVLPLQLEAFRHRPQAAHWNESHEARSEVDLPQVCWNLGLLKGDLDELIANEPYKRFYMHRAGQLAGHWTYTMWAIIRRGRRYGRELERAHGH